MSFLCGIWGTGKNPEPPEDIERLESALDGRYIAISTTSVVIATLGVGDCTCIDTGSRFTINTEKIVRGDIYQRKLAETIMYHDTNYAGHEYVICSMRSEHNDDSDGNESDSEKILIPMSDHLFHRFVDYPLITIVRSLYNPMSILRRVDYLWETQYMSAMDIGNMQLCVFVSIIRFQTKTKTILFAGKTKKNRNFVEKRAALARYAEQLQPLDTVYVVSIDDNMLKTRIDEQHLRMMESIIIDNSQIAAYLYDPADENDLVYD